MKTVKVTKVARTMTKTVIGMIRSEELHRRGVGFAPVSDARHSCPACPANTQIIPVGGEALGGESIVYCCPARKTITSSKILTKTAAKRTVTRTVSTTKTITRTAKALVVAGYVRLGNQPLAFKAIVITVSQAPKAVRAAPRFTILAQATTNATGYFSTTIADVPRGTDLFIADAATPQTPWGAAVRNDTQDTKIEIEIQIVVSTTAQGPTTTVCNCRAPTPLPVRVRSPPQGIDMLLESEPDDSIINTNYHSGNFQKRAILSPSTADSSDVTIGVWKSSCNHITTSFNNSLFGSRFKTGSSSLNVSLAHYGVNPGSNPSYYKVSIYSDDAANVKPLAELFPSNNVEVGRISNVNQAMAAWWNPPITLQSATTVSFHSKISEDAH